MIRAAFRVGALAVLLMAAARTQAQSALPTGVRGPVDAGNGVVRYDRVSAPAYPAYWWQRLFDLFRWKPAAKAPFRCSVAFLAGVSTYENRGLRPLQWVSSDLERLRNFLLSEGGFDTALELRERAVLRSTIEDYMATRFASASELLGPADRLLFLPM